MRIINWELARAWQNWVIVFLMVAFGAIVFSFINPFETEQGSK